MSKESPESIKILNHIGFIVDGNRRWAKQRHLPSLEGHRRGLKKVEKTIEYFSNLKVPFLSFFLFSTENWNRSAEEVEYLMDLFRDMAKKLEKIAKKHNLQIKALGADEPLPLDIQAQLQNLESLTSDNSGTAVCLCMNYGGQREIADAVGHLAQDLADGKIVMEHKTVMGKDGALGGKTVGTEGGAMRDRFEITPEILQNYIYHPEVPALDLMVRTSGEQRLSGFMLWRAAYAELLFIEKYFPELNEVDFAWILEEYQSRSRRFGR